MLDSARQRFRRLTRKLLSSPMWPVLGLTKTAETVVAGGPTGRWLAYSVLVTVVWVFGEAVSETVEEATDP
ncbi:hypothetical protein [Halostella sp. PRR32]|uniref:hypothetical protein n=1 Tax=Halostella sp. PRR32 TaxID=3098147 RepID=UPI002B1DA596|nr:hypothetical protein [Halostella sp. PRR32]